MHTHAIYSITFNIFCTFDVDLLTYGLWQVGLWWLVGELEISFCASWSRVRDHLPFEVVCTKWVATIQNPWRSIYVASFVIVVSASHTDADDRCTHEIQHQLQMNAFDILEGYVFGWRKALAEVWTVLSWRNINCYLHLLLLQLIDTSSLWPQLWTPQPRCEQSAKGVSLPVHCRSSSQIRPT